MLLFSMWSKVDLSRRMIACVAADPRVIKTISKGLQDDPTTESKRLETCLYMVYFVQIVVITKINV